ncbi:hypothetical protein AB0N23_16215 [Streptomyces sp. NPDC052644]
MQQDLRARRQLPARGRHGRPLATLSPAAAVLRRGVSRRRLTGHGLRLLLDGNTAPVRPFRAHVTALYGRTDGGGCL